jgi:hypothetical protein
LRRLKAATSADSIGNVSQNINEVAVPVLQNFVVVTRNERVRFIDEDGSVYEGRIESAPADVETKASDSQGRPPGAQTEVLAAAPMEQSKTEVQTVSYTFDAAGINQSLRRSVRFTGQMVLTGQQALQDRNAFANTLLPAQQRVQAGQQALPSVGVDGTLRLDDGTTLRVQAVPAAP